MSIPPVARLGAALRASALVLLLAAPAAAQRPTGAIAGVVRDSSGAPLVNVNVLIAARTAHTRTDSTGVFRFAALAPGKVELEFRRLGFEESTRQVTIAADRSADVTVVLVAIPQEMAAMIIAEEARAREALREFYDRKEAGFGHFITREQIEKRRPINLSDMMRMVPGAQLVPSRVGGTAVLRFARASSAPGRDCPPQYFVDGVMVRGFNIDDIPPSDVEGIEIYSGVSVIPPQFKNFLSTAICGVVAIWSRVPGT